MLGSSWFSWAFVIVFLNISALTSETPGVLDKIKTGLEYASSYIETARDIADLVSASLGHRRSNKKSNDANRQRGDTFEKSQSGSQGLAAAFFRLLGFDAPKINAIAVNSAIFLAQMISTVLDLKTRGKQPRSRNLNKERKDGDEDEEETLNPMRLILGSKNERIQRLILQARDEKLPAQLIDRMDGLDSSCIRLLICKVSPVIWAVQRSLTNTTGGFNRDVTSWLPLREEFEDNSEKCENTYADCRLFPPE